MTAKQPVGAVMVVGAGIGGMQASIDLANAGFKVYLVERDTAIGGRMAQLDKTFPTNDCSMCIISPKLIEVGRHPNIEILTNTEVLGLDGDPGTFQAKVMMHPRYVDLEKCTGCGECAKVCPIELPNEYNMGLDGRRAIRKRYPQAIPGGYAIEKKGTSPCRDACPVHTRCQGYVALIGQGRFADALKVIRRELPFPAVCGRVCPHPCEDACNRGKVDEPLAIRELKRFVSDYETTHEAAEALPEVAADTGKKIAVVGGGPAGLTAAWFLRLNGHAVTVFESAPEAGGMLRSGIPAYRLPREILAAEIKAIEDIGVEIRCNTRVGTDVSVDSLTSDYDSMFIAGGAQKARMLNVPGEDAEGVLPGIDFLRDVAYLNPPTLGRRVVVIGGGDVAYDVARTSLRVLTQADANAKREVHLCCLESREDMLASLDEIVEGEEEGVIRHNSVGPVEIHKDGAGKVTGITFRKCLSVLDENGRFAPTFDDNATETIECDNVIVAIGQGPDDFLSGSSLDKILNHGWIKADPLTFQTEVPNVFAGGDLQAGPGIAITAIAHGKEAAESIHRYLNGQDLREGREWLPKLAPEPKLSRVPEAHRPAPHHIDVEKRIGTFDEVAQVMTEEEAIAEAGRCLVCGTCSECGLCEETCVAKAIDHNMPERERILDVGSVILAPGFDQFEAEEIGEYGYGRWQNVITSMDFERMLSATGPSEGHVARISDGKHPHKIAWIQCVGSRDKRNDRNYCSAVCCMFATKEAVIATDHAGGDLQTTIFMMELRAAGKGFDDYCNRAQSQYGVRYVRSMISRVDEVPENQDIEVTYIGEDGKAVKETFDLLVLSTGLKPREEVAELAQRVGIELDDFGFAKTDPFKPLATTKPGVFVCGVMQGPKDIPESVAQASGAAAAATRHLGSARNTQIEQLQLVDEKDTDASDQRIGVWVCNCGINIGGIVNVPDVADYAGRHGDVVHAEGVLFACSQDNQEHMKEIIKEKGINRMVVASCTPRTHEPLFQATLRDTGINNYLFSMANIREHCSWVHQKEPERATDKAKMLVDMAINNARQLEPLHKQNQSLVHSALVIGGGLAGMTAALELADQGFPTTLIEMSDKLGGNLNKLRATHDGRPIKEFREDLIRRVNEHDKIEVLTSARLLRTDGFLGNFESLIEQSNGEKRRMSIKHGATVVAIGGRETKPDTFGYGESPAVITQLDLEQRLEHNPDEVSALKEVVMIQCVGSRNETRPYCSKVCCSQSLKNAILIKQNSPKTNVTILFRDMRSYGMKEKLYEQARQLGVLFVRYDLEHQPVVTPQGDKVLVEHPLPRLGKLKVQADLLVLAAAIEPNDNNVIAEILKLPRTADGYFLEVHQKLGPVDFPSDGVYMAGLAHGPKPIDETIAQASAAAARAMSILSKDHLSVGGQVSVVDPDKCAVCLGCVRACPYGVPIIDSNIGAAYINPAECRGCGVCASECPGKAIQLQHFTNSQIESILDVIQQHEEQEGGRIG